MHLGDTIRALRKQAGLSQAQLAGNEMSRPFISQVENGKCLPSPSTLKIIARRLDKPYTFFLLEDNDPRENISLLLKTVEENLNNLAPDEAFSRAREVVNMCRLSADSSLQARAHLLLGRAMMARQEYDEASEVLEIALNVFQNAEDRSGLARTLLLLGNCHLRTEEFKKAQRYYQRCITQTEGLKRLQSLHIAALIYRGSTFFRLGHLDPAAESYEKAANQAHQCAEGKLEVEARLGLSWVYYKQDNVSKAVAVARETLELSNRANRHLHTQLEHNLGIMEAAQGWWEQALTRWQRCLDHYREQNDLLQQAAVLEEIAGYWLRKGDLDQAENVCWKGHSLLDLMENSLLRGRIYRTLGDVYCARGNWFRAYELYRLSLEWFRRLKASEEISLTTSRLESIHLTFPSTDTPQ